MAQFPLGEHVTDEWYPGATLPLPRHPQMEEGFELFKPDDEPRFWLLEGHWSRGFTPMCVSTAYDVLWGTQFGANMYQLPPTKGQAARMSGVHGYVSDLPCHSPWEMMHRSTRVEKLVGPAIMAFPTLWAERLADIKAALAHFEQADLASMGLPELAVYLGEFWAFHRWVWEVHFELMDPLIGNYFAFRATCVELGIDERDVTRFFQGADTRVMQTDRALWGLAVAARGTATEKVLAGADSLAALRDSTDPVVVAWREQLDEFLQEYGWRTEGMCDPTLAPWVEDPTPVVTMLTTFLRKDADHDFDAAQRDAIAERDETLARVRAGLSGDALERFEGGLGACYHANFAWWQEEHNVYIDMRAHIPLRMAALRAGEIVGVDRRDDLIYLFRHELDDLVGGAITYGDVRDLIAARRRYYEEGAARRAEMPRVLGTPSAETDDPVMKEIFGVDQRLLDAVSSADLAATELVGVPASSGVVQGRARVITSSDFLGDVEPDEILVCVFTTPNWTPAFSQIAGCVCDTGGALSHTAIVSREYRIPAVCGTGLATTLIHTGDLLEVDGTAGVVRIIERGERMTGTLLQGGRIRTTFDGKVLDAIGVRDGRIVAVDDGSFDDTIDLDGAWVVPGLIDTHPHLLHFSIAGLATAVSLQLATDHASIVEAISRKAAFEPAGEWVIATPVGEPHYFFRRGYLDLTEGELPDRHTLDRATERHPVLIQAWSPTMPNVCALNSLGLAAVGIDETTPDRVADVWIEKDATGQPTGRLRGAVTTNYNTDPFFREVLLKLPGPQPGTIKPAVMRGMLDALSTGVTSVYEPHAMEQRHIDLYRSLRDTGGLTMRVKAVPEYQRFTRPTDPVKSRDELAESLRAALAAVDLDDDWVRSEGITVSATGTCAPGNMKWPTPYHDAFGHETTGHWFISDDAVDLAARFCAQHGLQLNFCAMGPSEHDLFLDAVERHGVRGGVVQHGAIMPIEHARRWAAAGFRQTVCCGFTWGKGDVYRRAFGDQVLRDLNPLRRLLDAGLTLAAATDWGPKNPWEQMWLAETHLLGRSGVRNDGADQVITRQEALHMWTAGGAAVLDWPELGRLTPGAYADLVVVDRDPLTCAIDDLPQVAVQATMTGGAVVYGSLD